MQNNRFLHSFFKENLMCLPVKKLSGLLLGGSVVVSTFPDNC